MTHSLSCSLCTNTEITILACYEERVSKVLAKCHWVVRAVLLRTSPKHVLCFPWACAETIQQSLKCMCNCIIHAVAAGARARWRPRGGE